MPRTLTTTISHVNAPRSLLNIVELARLPFTKVQGGERSYILKDESERFGEERQMAWSAVHVVK